MAAILEMPQYVAYQKNVVYAFIKLSAKSHSFNILCTMDGLSCPTTKRDAMLCGTANVLTLVPINLRKVAFSKTQHPGTARMAVTVCVSSTNDFVSDCLVKNAFMSELRFFFFFFFLGAGLYGGPIGVSITPRAIKKQRKNEPTTYATHIQTKFSAYGQITFALIQLYLVTDPQSMGQN